MAKTNKPGRPKKETGKPETKKVNPSTANKEAVEAKKVEANNPSIENKAEAKAKAENKGNNGLPSQIEELKKTISAKDRANSELSLKIDALGKRLDDKTQAFERVREQLGRSEDNFYKASKELGTTKKNLGELRADVNAFIGKGFFFRVWTAMSETRLRKELI